MNAATNQPSVLTLRLGQSDQAGQEDISSVPYLGEFESLGMVETPILPSKP